MSPNQRESMAFWKTEFKMRLMRLCIERLVGSAELFRSAISVKIPESMFRTVIIRWDRPGHLSSCHQPQPMFCTLHFRKVHLVSGLSTWIISTAAVRVNRRFSSVEPYRYEWILLNSIISRIVLRISIHSSSESSTCGNRQAMNVDQQGRVFKIQHTTPAFSELN